MGAHAEIESNTAICHGVKQLSGAQVMATICVRQPAWCWRAVLRKVRRLSIVFTTLTAATNVSKTKLQALGANIERVKGE
jgi:UDP-N-acetylglucosamine 1-carboxyvinyltransferase